MILYNNGDLLNLIEDDRRCNFVKASVLLGELTISHIKISKKGFPYISFVFPNGWVFYISKDIRIAKFFLLFSKFAPDKQVISFEEFLKTVRSDSYDEKSMVSLISSYLPYVKHPIIFKCKVYHEQIFVYELVDEQSENIPYWEQRKVVSCILNELGFRFKEEMVQYVPVWYVDLDDINIGNGNSSGFILRSSIVIKSGGNIGKNLVTVLIESTGSKLGNKFVLSQAVSVPRGADSEDIFRSKLLNVIDIYKKSKDIFMKASKEGMAYDEGIGWIHGKLGSVLMIRNTVLLSKVIESVSKIYEERFRVSESKISLAESLSIFGTYPNVSEINEKVCRKLQISAYEILSS